MTPTTIPAALLDLLMFTKPDWISHRWSKMFNSIFSQHSPATPCGHTPLATGDTVTSALAVEHSHIQRRKRPYANLSPTLDDSTSNTPQSKATSLVSDSSTLHKSIQTLSTMTCPGSTMSYEVSNPRKRRRVAHKDNGSQ